MADLAGLRISEHFNNIDDLINIFITYQVVKWQTQQLITYPLCDRAITIFSTKYLAHR